MRLNFGGEDTRFTDEALLDWLRDFGATAETAQGSLLSRYRLLSVLLEKLTETRTKIEERLKAQSPLERYDDVEPELRDKWEHELVAAIEAEYRRQRTELLTGLQWWLRDVRLQSLAANGHSLAFPQLREATHVVARRLSSTEAMENLRHLERTQWLLGTNIQEALALEVGLLKLKL